MLQHSCGYDMYVLLMHSLFGWHLIPVYIQLINICSASVVWHTSVSVCVFLW